MAKAEYMGGHPRMRKQAKGKLHMKRKGLRFRYGLFGKLLIPISDIHSMQAMTEEQISKDVTLTRLLFLGVFALGAKKKRVDKTPFLTVECTVDGNETHVVFKDPNAHKNNARFYALQRRIRKCHSTIGG